MLYSQYCRIEAAAGGVGCTAREFVRAAHKKINAKGKTRALRDARHAWLRAGLKYRVDARCTVNTFRL